MAAAATVQSGAEHSQQRPPTVLAGTGAPAGHHVHGARLLVALQARPAAAVRLAAALVRHLVARGQPTALWLYGARRVQLLHGRHTAFLAGTAPADNTRTT